MNNPGRALRVLFVSHSSNMGGAERSLLLLLSHLDRDRFEPIVVVPTAGPLRRHIESLGITTYQIQSPWWVRERLGIARFVYCVAAELMALARYRAVTGPDRADVIYTNSIVTFSGAISARMRRRPHIWHIREILPENPDLHFFFSTEMLFRFVSSSSSRIIANSKATAAQFEGRGFMERVEVVYNAVDLQEFSSPAPFPGIDGVEPQDWLAVVVGSLRRRKAQEDAIRAVKIAEETIPNLKLLLIGEGEREFTDYLRQQASRLGLSERVVLAGYRDDVAEILPHCRVLLMLSRDESFGRSTIEAMAAGLPVVASDSGATREIVQDGTTGYLVSPGEPAEIAEKLVQLYQQPEKARELGNNGKRVATERFAPSTYVRSIEEIILRAADRC